MRRILIVLIFSFIVFPSVLPVYAETDKGIDTAALLGEAEAAFKDGNELLDSSPESAMEAYRLAVICYNSIIESGTVNADLHYNTANAYVRLGEIGNAILHYRKALLYKPNDVQINYNLEYARSLQKNGFEPNAENEILQILLFWHFLMPVFLKVILLAAANLVFWTSLILKRLGRFAGRVIIISLIITLVLGTSVLFDFRESAVLHGVVTAESTIGRLGDSRSYEPAFEAPLFQGVEFTVRQHRVGWLLVELPNNELVWLDEADCGIIE